MESKSNPQEGSPLPTESIAKAWTPEEVTEWYKKFKAEFVPPSEEEVLKLVAESVYQLEDTLKFLEELEQKPASRDP